MPARLEKAKATIENNGHYSLPDDISIRSTWLYEKEFIEQISQSDRHSGLFQYLDEQSNIQGGDLRYRYQSERSTSIVKDIMSLLETLSNEGIVIPNPGEVSDYLFRFPDTISLVLEVCRFTAGHFWDKAELSLELYRDPEQEDHYLTLYVRQEIYERTIMRQLLGISDSFEESFNECSGWLIVTTDYNPPRSKL